MAPDPLLRQRRSSCESATIRPADGCEHSVTHKPGVDRMTGQKPTAT